MEAIYFNREMPPLSPMTCKAERRAEESIGTGAAFPNCGNTSSNNYGVDKPKRHPSNAPYIRNGHTDFFLRGGPTNCSDDKFCGIIHLRIQNCQRYCSVKSTEYQEHIVDLAYLKISALGSMSMYEVILSHSAQLTSSTSLGFSKISPLQTTT